MPAEMNDAIHSFIATFANMDLRGAPILCLMLAAAAFVCLEGIKIYKMVLYAGAFIFGFRYTRNLLWARIPSDELLLMIEVGVGLLLAVLAWKIYLLGVGLLAYQFARENFRDFFDGPFAVLLCFAVSVLIAILAMKLNRAVIVILTAVVGGFAMVNIFLKLIPVFPVDLSFFPVATSPIWLIAKVFLSAAGVGVQDVREPS
ncbi:MAG: TMEM198/TM7SF3 family protein [Lachnospiraceae bacterium]|nr:TMEM198/TM7SF3 family protein [Lachnospiraceae bacterium]